MIHTKVHLVSPGYPQHSAESWSKTPFISFFFTASFVEAETILKECREFLANHGIVLYAHNVYVVQITDYLMDACIDLQRWDDACQYAEANAQPYR